MMTSMNLSNDMECVLISDEEEDDAAAPIKASVKNISLGNFVNKNVADKDDRAASASIDDSDGRRMSRRRKNKTDPGDLPKGGEGPKLTAEPNSDGGNNIDKKTNENRAETRSRKRERSGSPANADSKEAEPIPFKEILTGLEGAAFQSRYESQLCLKSIFPGDQVSVTFVSGNYVCVAYIIIIIR